MVSKDEAVLLEDEEVKEEEEVKVEDNSDSALDDEVSEALLADIKPGVS